MDRKITPTRVYVWVSNHLRHREKAASQDGNTKYMPAESYISTSTGVVSCHDGGQVIAGSGVADEVTPGERG